MRLVPPALLQFSPKIVGGSDFHKMGQRMVSPTWRRDVCMARSLDDAIMSESWYPSWYRAPIIGLFSSTRKLGILFPVQSANRAPC